MCLDMLQINEPIRDIGPSLVLTNNFTYIGGNAMAELPIPKEERECQVPGCARTYYALGYCEKHRKQIRKYGHIQSRTTFDPNTFEIDGDICKIGIFNRACDKISETIIDAEDYPLVKDSKWCLNPSPYGPYIVTGAGKNRVRLHNLVMGVDRVDHKDHDTLNNRKKNLREYAGGQNRQNAKINGNSKSGVKNVFKEKATGKWMVCVSANKVRHYIGRFDILEDAQKAAQVARDKYHGQFSNGR